MAPDSSDCRSDLADKDSMVTIWAGVTVGCEIAAPVEPLEQSIVVLTRANARQKAEKTMLETSRLHKELLRPPRLLHGRR